MERSLEIGPTNFRPGFEAMRRHAVWILAGVSLLVISWAVRTYVVQFLHGLGVTGLNKPTFWGIYIVNFIFCVGLSAGGIAVSALVHLGGKEDMKPVGVAAEVMATSFLILAGTFILMDLGQPSRMYYVFLYSNFTSPLLWDVTVISSYLILCMALLYFSVRTDLIRRYQDDSRWKWTLRLLTLGRNKLTPKSIRRDHSLLWMLSFISIPGAVALHSVTAWILGLVAGQPGWNTAILAPLFIASALVSGFAVVTLAVILARGVFNLPVPEQVIERLGRYLLLAIPLLMYLLFSEFLTVGYSGTLTHLAVFDEILWGRFARIFWFDVVVGILIPFTLLGMPWTRNLYGIAVASFLVVVGVFSERVYLLLPSLLRPEPFTHHIPLYTPSVVEWSLMAGAYAFGLLLFLTITGTIFGLRASEQLAREPRTIAAALQPSLHPGSTSASAQES